MVVIDASILFLFFDPNAPGPHDDLGRVVQHPGKRVEFLIQELDRTNTKIVVPAPALTEILIKRSLDDSQRIVQILQSKALFRIEPFDQRAAIECAEILRSELKQGQTLKDGPETWAKLKFDRQIVAIAKVVGASRIYSDDRKLKKLAERLNISARGVSDLPLPPDGGQPDLFEGEE